MVCLTINLFVLCLSDLCGNIICFNMECQVRGSDTSTAESGSEAEDATSPKALRSYISHPKLTPVREEVSSLDYIVLRCSYL